MRGGDRRAGRAVGCIFAQINISLDDIAMVVHTA